MAVVGLNSAMHRLTLWSLSCKRQLCPEGLLVREGDLTWEGLSGMCSWLVPSLSVLG